MCTLAYLYGLIGKKVRLTIRSDIVRDLWIIDIYIKILALKENMTKSMFLSFNQNIWYNIKLIAESRTFNFKFLLLLSGFDSKYWKKKFSVYVAVNINVNMNLNWILRKNQKWPGTFNTVTYNIIHVSIKHTTKTTHISMAKT